jgi:hypothetical protein
MKEFLVSVGIGLVVILLGGIMVSIVWGLVVPYILPGLVASGMVAGKISLWTGIGVSLLISLLLGSMGVKGNRG